MHLRFVLLAIAATAMFGAASAPARADGDWGRHGWDHRRWGGHEEWRGHWRHHWRPPVYSYGYGYGYGARYYAPPPVYHAPGY